MVIDRRTVLKGLGIALAHIGPARALAPANEATIPVPTPVPMSLRLAEFVRRVRFEDLPPEVVEKAKAQLVYHLGLAFSGIAMQESVEARTVMQPLAKARGATVVGERFRLPIADAAFYNTTLMRAVWRDDVTWPTGIHAGILIYPPGLALAEARHASGRELLIAVVLGYEVMCTLARAADPWAAAQPRRPSMVYGGYGPITVAGRLMNLDVPRLANGYGYAANVAMGVPQGGQTTQFYGLLCRNATFSAELAEVGGAPYSPYTIEGSGGLYESFFGEMPANVPSLIASLGSRWEILTAAQKRFPGTGQNTVPTEVLKTLIGEAHLTPENVVRIDAITGAVADSPERKKELASLGPFKDWVDAWASLPYSLAVVLVAGNLDPAGYQENLQNPRVTAAMRLVHLHTESGHDAPRYARIEVTTRDGRRLVRDRNNVVYPFPREAWGPWLRQDGPRILPEDQLLALERLIADLEHVEDVAILTATLVPPKAHA